MTTDHRNIKRKNNHKFTDWIYTHSLGTIYTFEQKPINFAMDSKPIKLSNDGKPILPDGPLCTKFANEEKYKEMEKKWFEITEEKERENETQKEMLDKENERELSGLQDRFIKEQTIHNYRQTAMDPKVNETQPPDWDKVTGPDWNKLPVPTQEEVDILLDINTINNQINHNRNLINNLMTENHHLYRLTQELEGLNDYENSYSEFKAKYMGYLAFRKGYHAPQHDQNVQLNWVPSRLVINKNKKEFVEEEGEVKILFDHLNKIID